MIWDSQVLILFSISDTICAFLCPFPRSSEKPEQLKKFLPCYHHYELRASVDNTYELGFMSASHCVFHSSPTNKNETYINWLDKMENKKE